MNHEGSSNVLGHAGHPVNEAWGSTGGSRSNSPGVLSFSSRISWRRKSRISFCKNHEKKRGVSTTIRKSISWHMRSRLPREFPSDHRYRSVQKIAPKSRMLRAKRAHAHLGIRPHVLHIFLGTLLALCIAGHCPLPKALYNSMNPHAPTCNKCRSGEANDGACSRANEPR